MGIPKTSVITGYPFTPFKAFTGNVVFDLHALPGFGIFTFFFVVDEVDEPFVKHFKIPYLSFAQFVKPHPSALQSSLYLRLALPHFFKEEHPVVFVAVQGQVTPSVENAIHAMYNRTSHQCKSNEDLHFEVANG